MPAAFMAARARSILTPKSMPADVIEMMVSAVRFGAMSTRWLLILSALIAAVILVAGGVWLLLGML